MCLGMPGRIVETWLRDDGAPMARVDYLDPEGTRLDSRPVCLAYLSDLVVGDYCVAHLGYAITRLDEDAARATLATLHDYGVLDAMR